MSKIIPFESKRYRIKTADLRRLAVIVRVNLAEQAAQNNELDEAAGFYREALSEAESQFGTGSALAAWVLWNWCDFCAVNGQQEEAARLKQRFDAVFYALLDEFLRQLPLD
jgi:hypothetical protein